MINVCVSCTCRQNSFQISFWQSVHPLRLYISNGALGKQKIRVKIACFGEGMQATIVLIGEIQNNTRTLVSLAVPVGVYASINAAPKPIRLNLSFGVQTEMHGPNSIMKKNVILN
jgi:hypothetical protein